MNKERTHLKVGRLLAVLLTAFLISGTSIIAYAEEAASSRPIDDMLRGFGKGTGECVGGFADGTGKVLKGASEGTGGFFNGAVDEAGKIGDGVGKGAQNLYEWAVPEKKS